MPNLDPITGFPIPDDYGNTGLDKFTAGMALANPISGWSDRRFAPSYKADVPEEYKVDYDPWADPRIDKYDPMHFVDSNSNEETTNIISDIERNMALQKRATGVPSVFGTITGVFSNPLIMLPAIATSGSSIPAMMAAEAGGEILSEAILHSQQPLRTKTESALNIGFATTAAGLGGLAAKKLARSALPKGADTAHGGDGMYAYPIPEEARSGVVRPSREFVEDVPEDVTMRMSIEDVDDGMIWVEEAGEMVQKPIPEAAKKLGAGDVIPASPLGDLLARISPAGDILFTSESEAAKEAVQLLVDVPYRFDKGIAVPQSVETKVHQAEGDWSSMKQVFDKEYNKYRKAGGDLTADEFAEEIGHAMVRGDQSILPEAQAAAQYFRKFDDSYFKQANKLGLYGDKPPPLKGSKSHLQRISQTYDSS